MPYDKLSELPDSVKDNLPKHAQEIFLAAFNSASKQYDDESRWFATAWAAVENSYSHLTSKMLYTISTYPLP